MLTTEDDRARMLAKNRFLADKVRLLEAMVEDRTRDAYLEHERRASLIALLRHCQAAVDLPGLLAGSLDILLDRDFLRFMQKGAVYVVGADDELVRVVERNLDEAVLASCARIQFGHCICGRAAASGQITFADDAEEDDGARIDRTPHNHYAIPIVVNGRTEALFLLCLPRYILEDEVERGFFEAFAAAEAGALVRLQHQEAIVGYQRRLEQEIHKKTVSLQEVEARYGRLFANAVEGVFQTSMTGQILDCNPAFARMLGYDSPAEIIAMVSDVGNQLYADPADRARLLVRLAEQGQALGFVMRLRCKDGTEIWVESNSRLTPGGEPDGWILEGMAMDITRRREAELSLAAEKERLAVTLRSIGDGVVTTDTVGQVTLLNLVAEHLTGWTQEEAQGRPVTEIFRIINEKTRIPCENSVEKVFATGRIVGLANHTALIAKDGTERAIADSGAPIRDHEGQVIGAVLVFRDVTHQNRMEHEIQKVQKLESIGTLAGGIAHDFNNILTAIMGNISLALRLVGADDQIHQLMSDAEKAARRAQKLTQQLLTFARGGAPVKETAALGEVIKESSDFILHGRAVASVYQLPADLRLVDIDRGQISQVVQNLVLNACQAMPDGGSIVISGANVEVCEDDPALPLRSGSYVRVSVQDSGLGIPAGQCEKVFDPYFTTKQQGSGLGLAITHSIIKKHGGHIAVQSELGEGSVFSFYLPVSAAEMARSAQTVQQMTCAGGRVLVMDDEPTIRQICTAILEHLGYQAEGAAEGQEALRLALAAQQSGQPFDVVIMDLTVPGGMGGEETARLFKEKGLEAALIASSGYCNDPVMANCAQHGFAGAIVKPYLVGELAGTIQRVLAERRRA